MNRSKTMQRARLTWAIPLIVAIWAGLTIACVTAVGAAGPVPPLVAQAATAVPNGSVVTAITPVASPLSTAPSASIAAGTSVVATPPIAATAETASAVAPLAIPPASSIVTSSGPDRESVIIVLIGMIGAVVLIPLGAWGLIRMIATAGRS